jgi:hypothetical protein
MSLSQPFNVAKLLSGIHDNHFVAVSELLFVHGLLWLVMCYFSFWASAVLNGEVFNFECGNSDVCSNN